MAKANNPRLISKSLKPWVRDLQRLEREPTGTTEVALNNVLDQAYVASQIFVHTVSGRLKASGHAEATTRRSARSNRWIGTIGYGRGLDYAKFEFDSDPQRMRHDWIVHPSHDPYDGLEIFYAEIDIILGKLM